MTTEVVLAIAGIVLVVYGILGRKMKGVEVKDYKLFTEPLDRWQRLVLAILGFAFIVISVLPILGIKLPTATATPVAAVAETSAPTFISTAAPNATSTSAPTQTPAPTNTPLPPPLVEIFPQAGDGEESAFINQGGFLVNEFVLNQDCAHSGPYGLRLTYDMKGEGNGGWSVHWDNAPEKHFNAAGFTTFGFYVRGESGGETFQIGLKDTSGKEVKVETKRLLVVTSGWMLVTVPLSEFKGVNTASINNVNFGFNRNHGSGSICIDDLAFFAP